MTSTADSAHSSSTARFEALYRAHAADVYVYVASVLGDRPSAEDVTALAFERAYRRRRLFSPRRGTERAWLFAIARNAALDELRRRRRQPQAPGGVDLLEAAGAQESGPDELAVMASQRARVRAALGELHPREREIVLLKFHGGLSTAELARALGTSQGNAATRLYRAVKRLREICHEAS